MQVYRHYENVSTGNQDSYAEMQCNVCHNNSNESLLMLCDLCDSASHTYCVGLGDTVPEDDWICRDCNLLMYEHAEDDNDLNADGLSAIDYSSRNQSRWENHQNVPSAEPTVSILDIVRESRSYDAVRPSWNRSNSPSTQVRDDGISIAAANVEHNPQAESYVGHSGRQFAARTVQYCRTVDSRIRALRENWDKIREGSLSFSSFLISKPGRGRVSCGTSSIMNLSSCSDQQSHPKSSSSNIIPNPATEDIKKAWKMMNAAMSTEKRKCTNNVNGSKRPLSDTRTPRKSAMPLSSHHIGDKGQDCNKLKKRYEEYCAAEKRNDKRKYDDMFQKVKPCTVLNHHGYPATYSTESSKLSASEKVQHSVKDRIYQKTQNNTLETFCNNSSKNHDSYAFRSAGPEDRHYAAKQNVVPVSSSCNGKEVINVEKHHADGTAKMESDAKSEIQSLVKLNLKLLTRYKKLGMAFTFSSNTFHSFLGQFNAYICRVVLILYSPS